MERKKRVAMINVVGTNIISSLGFTADENFANVKRGVSGVKHYDAGTFGLPEAFMASLVDKEHLNDSFSEISTGNAYTNLEKAAILSVFTANKTAGIDLSGERVLFVLSTTKGNVDLLGKAGAYLWYSAQQIASFFDNPNTPLVVSCACISGAAAQIAAMRELENNNFDYAAVTGVDFLSKFIISGFQSFKALSPELCKPFDKDRKGLNLGEAAATIIYSRQSAKTAHYHPYLQNGAIRNDANHISAPSRTGEGSFRALQYVLHEVDKEQIAFLNAHGTATSYNDAMEAIAIIRAGLNNVPVNSLKPFFGHTLGAAGVLESIISMRGLEESLVLKSANFNEQDFENKINIPQENCFSDKKYFVKTLSGFGSCNAALLFGRSYESYVN
jgi:3-oxoacyl-[acyl-carrier-protein] synthase-1